MAFITQTEYAKRVGVATRTIRRHISKGKIFGDALNEKNMIDPVIAGQQLQAGLSGLGGKREKPGEGDPMRHSRYVDIDASAGEKTDKRRSRQSNNDSEADADSKVFLKSRSVKEAISAKMAGIVLKEKEGTLINRESVRTALFDYGRVARDKLLAVGVRIAPLVVTMESEHAIKELIDLEIREAIAQLAVAYKDFE